MLVWCVSSAVLYCQGNCCAPPPALPGCDWLALLIITLPQVNKAGYRYVDVVAMETSFWARSPPSDSTSTKDTGRLAKSCLKTGQCLSGGWGSVCREGGAVSVRRVGHCLSGGWGSVCQEGGALSVRRVGHCLLGGCGIHVCAWPVKN